MCFSAEASFLTSGALVVAGATAQTRRPGQGRRQTWPLALIPLLFGLQQGLEGLVWLGMDHQHGASGGDSTTVAASLAYLFFAYAFWPVWLRDPALSTHWSESPETGRTSTG